MSINLQQQSYPGCGNKRAQPTRLPLVRRVYPSIIREAGWNYKLNGDWRNFCSWPT